MRTKKAVILTVSVGLCLVLALTTLAWAGQGAAGPFGQSGSAPAAGSAHYEFVSHLGAPAYDSGWEALGIRPDPIAVEFAHRLGGKADDYLIGLKCRDNTSLGIYQGVDHGFNANAFWYGLTNSRISVWAIGGSRPDDVRLRIYKATPAYDSGWEALGIRPDPIAVEFAHRLGGSADNYFISLECRDDTSLGTYQGTDYSFNANAFWYGLTNSRISVWAASGRPDDVRLRIYRGAPAYDSGWRALGIRPDPIAVEFTHGLGGDPSDYLVSLKCRDNTSLGTYQGIDYSFNVNASWYGLTNSKIRVWATSGSRPDDVRVRIWRADSVSLPLLANDLRTP